MTYRDSELEYAPAPVVDGVETGEADAVRGPEAGEAVPPLGSGEWPEIAAPLLRFVAESPRCWHEIFSWGRWGERGGGRGRRRHPRASEYLLRNAIAWLEEHGLVTCTVRRGEAVWRSVVRREVLP